MSTALKMGVIGLGRMGQLYARTVATQVSGVYLYAVANLDEHASKQVAEEFGVSHVFADAYELMAFPELDAVVIATPPNTHHDLARWLMGSEVERVIAEGALLFCKDLESVGDIDNALINLHFMSGALGNVEENRNAFYGYDIRTKVLGSEGAVRAYQAGHSVSLRELRLSS